MTKVTVDLSKIRAATQSIKNQLNQREVLSKAADIAINDIKGNAREGKPVVDNKVSSFPSLDDKYITRRKRLASVNETDSVYSPKRSNLTFTGQLLNSLKATFKGAIITISPTGKRRPYKLIKGGRTKSVENKIVAEGLQDRGFKFLSIGRSTKKKIKSEITRIIRRLLRS